MHYVVFWMKDAISLLMYDTFNFATELIYINPELKNLKLCINYQFSTELVNTFAKLIK